jgi:xanthine dehydrogenase accessory factor
LVQRAAGEGRRAEGKTPATGDRHYAVVATMGQFDEDALTDAIALIPAYVGLVASRKRFAQIRGTLLDRGIAGAALDRVHCPAGLDIGAHTPEEIAVSILAEIVQDGAGVAAEPAREPPRQAELRTLEPPALPASPVAHSVAAERDPVCGMSVIATATTPSALFDGCTYYFCCGGCRARFTAHPERYLTAAAR